MRIDYSQFMFSLVNISRGRLSLRSTCRKKIEGYQYEEQFDSSSWIHF